MRPDPAARMRRQGAVARRLFTALWFGISVALVAPAPAQETVVEEDVAPAPVSGILILNQERLFARSLYGQRIQRELEDASARLAAENRRIEARLTEEELELTELRGTLEATEFRTLADAFDSRVEVIRAEQEAKARNLTGQADAAQSQFFESVAPILLAIVRDRNAAVLMDSRSVLLSADRVDVTEAAIAAIDETLGEGGAEPIITIDVDAVPDGTSPPPADGTAP